MNSLETAALTAFFGVLVFVLGQFVQKFILEPIQEQRKVIAEIAFVLVFLRNVSKGSISTEEELHEANATIRRLAAQLRATLWTIPLYGVFARLRIVPERKAIFEASKALIGWSNSIYSGGISIAENIKMVEQILHLE
ncbi:MAG: hypothetical protein H7175_01850 [Burkholderiales bacterium]|nr:hypothetical protein [Anaerolineae bacterium]